MGAKKLADLTLEHMWMLHGTPKTIVFHQEIIFVP